MRFEGWLIADQSSPSHKAMRAERALRLAAVIEQLPDAQRVAVEQHYFAGSSLAEIAAHVGRSPAAVAGLLRRGLESLRNQLSTDESMP